MPKVLSFSSVGSPREVAGNGSGTRRFGVFELDLRIGELRRNGLKVKLQEQPFQVLAQLLEKPGEVVAREDLRNRLWPADTFVDFDHSLNAAIRRLRDALGDSAENPKFVETVARRGYRFLAPVSTVPTNGNGMAEVQRADTASARTAARLRFWGIAAAVTAVVLVLFGLALGLFLAPREPAPVHAVRLTANPVDDPVRAVAISRDGRYVAFSDQTGFYLRQIDTGETHSMAVPEGLLVTSVGWFPDSVHMIVGMRGSGRESSLWEISVLGGSARKLIDEGRSPSVSPDGKEIAFIAGDSGGERVRLAGIDGTQSRTLVGERGDLFGAVAWSPDGRRIAYTTAKFAYGHGVKATIAVADLRPQRSDTVLGHTSRVLSLAGLDGPLAWAPDGRLIYSIAEPRPRQLDSNLWSIRLGPQTEPDGPPVRLTNDPGVVFSVASSGDSKRIIYLKGVPQPDVYVGRLEHSGSLSEPQRLTLDDRQDLPFDWTADGKEVIFISDRTGTFNVYKQAIGQAVPDVVVGGNQPVTEPRLSPDGTQLLYLVYPSAGESTSDIPLMRVPLAGGAPQAILKANWISNHQCARAPASVCIYSVVTEHDLTFFTFDPFQGQGSQVYQIKDDLPQLYNWSLSPDGTTLAIAKGKWAEEEPRIHLVSLRGAAERWLTLQGWTGLVSLDWAADSKGIWACSSEEKNALLYIDLQGNAHSVWRPTKTRVGWAIPSRDGKYLALHVNSKSANVWMLERP